MPETVEYLGTIKDQVCYNATEYLQLKSAVWHACMTAEGIGLIIGIAGGMVIGALIYRQVMNHGLYKK